MAKRGKNSTRPRKRGPGKQPSGRKLPGFDTVFYAVTIVLTYAVYHGIVDNFLFNDDFIWLTKARYEMGGDVLGTRVIGFFRPFMNLSFYLMERIAPGNLKAYYLSGILLHWLNGVLIYHLSRSLFRDRIAAAATAVFFLFGSFHFAAIGWLSARTTLFSAFFLLLALLLATRPPVSRVRVVGAAVSYALALATKETAIAGVFLMALIWMFDRRRKDAVVPAATVVAFAVLGAAYLAIRQLSLGFTHDNWGPGLHVLSNTCGGILFMFFAPPATLIPGVGVSALSAPSWIDYTALPLAAVLLVVARRAGRFREVGFGLAWAALALLPVAMWEFRFNEVASIPHTRYYYVPAVGVVVSIVALLSALWHSGPRRRILAAAIFAALCAGTTTKTIYLERRWDELTDNFRRIVDVVDSRIETAPQMSVCVVDNSPVDIRYLAGGIRLKRAHWTVIEGNGTEEFVESHKPCIYIEFFEQGPGKMGMRSYRVD